MRGRVAFGALGVGLMAFGGFRLVAEVPSGQLLRVGAWWIGGVAVHDAVLAPAALVLGWLVLRWLPEPARAPLRAGLLVVTSLVVIAVPLLRTTSPAANSSVITGEAGRSLLLLGATTTVVSVLAAAFRVGRSRPSERP